MKQTLYEWFFSYKVPDGSGHCFITLNSNKPSRALIEAAAKMIQEKHDGIDVIIAFYECLGAAYPEESE